MKYFIIVIQFLLVSQLANAQSIPSFNLDEIYEIRLIDGSTLHDVKILKKNRQEFIIFHKGKRKHVAINNISRITNEKIDYQLSLANNNPQKTKNQNTKSYIARKQRKVGSSLTIGGEILAGLSIDFFPIPEVKIEMTGSPIGYGGGISYYLPIDLNGWAPFIGLRGGHYYIDFLGKTTYDVLYLPVGLSYYFENGLFLSADVGYISKSIYDEPWSGFCLFGCDPVYPTTSKYDGLMATFKVGYRIRTSKAK